MIHDSFDKMLLGELVAEDFRTAEIFKKAGIDFCCGGKKTLEQACQEKNIDQKLIGEELKALASVPVAANLNFKDWDLDFLVDYIVNTHHKYVIKTMPDLIFYTHKIATVHGSRHPELVEVEKIFQQVNKELHQHLQQEEDVLFPAIKAALTQRSEALRAKISSEIIRMSDEHESAGGAMDKISELTDHYTLPGDTCNSYLVTFNLLNQFEDDLHIHVHLENNILYPKALKL
jgi:regulator of cell morphogenesis and NO signaling